MFLLELFVRFDAIFAHSECDSTLSFKLFSHFLELDSLSSASWCSVFRIEIEDHLLASIIAQRHFFSIICL